MDYRSNPTQKLWHGNAKLTSYDVQDILAKRIYGWSARQLADYFEVGKSTITDIWEGKTWKHVSTFRKPCSKKPVANCNEEW